MKKIKATILLQASFLVQRVRFALHRYMIKKTGFDRGFIDLKWADITSWSFNAFRTYEYFFGKKVINGKFLVKPHMANLPTKFKGMREIYAFFSFEVVLVHFESLARKYIAEVIKRAEHSFIKGKSKFRLPEIRFGGIYFPQLAFAGVHVPFNNGLKIENNIQRAKVLFAIALDTSTISSELNNGGASSTITCTGSNGALVYGHFLEQTAADQNTAVTYNSVGMTAVASATASGSSTFMKGWYLGSPTTGSALIIQPTNTSQFNQGGAVSYSGASSTNDGGIGAGQTTSHTTIAATITPITSGNNDWVFFACGAVGGGFSASSGTVRQTGTAPMCVGDSNATVSSSGFTETITMNNSAQSTLILIAIAPAAAASSIKTIDQTAKASIKTINGNSSYKAWDGIL